MRDDYYHGDREQKNSVRGVNQSSTVLGDQPSDAASEGAVEQRQRGPADGPQRATLGITKAVESILEALFG